MTSPLAIFSFDQFFLLIFLFFLWLVLLLWETVTRFWQLLEVSFCLKKQIFMLGILKSTVSFGNKGLQNQMYKVNSHPFLHNTLNRFTRTRTSDLPALGVLYYFCTMIKTSEGWVATITQPGFVISENAKIYVKSILTILESPKLPFWEIS